MQPYDFNENKAGRLVEGKRRYWAFVPAPLEPKLKVNMTLVKALSEADRALSELAGTAREFRTSQNWTGAPGCTLTENLLPQPLLYLSAFFEKYRREYYDHLLAVSQRGAWLAWIGFFLNAAAGILDVTHRSAQLNIDKLIKAGILREATGQKRNRIYVAHEIVSIIDRAER